MECRVWIARNATRLVRVSENNSHIIAIVSTVVHNNVRNAQVFQKKRPKVLKKLSDSRPVKPLPVLKSIEQLATELLSSMIDISMNDLRYGKKRPCMGCQDDE